MRFSVSAVCLDRTRFEQSVLALLEHPVSDLHCDYFPELGGAPSLSAGQLDWCLREWPRDVTIHIWGRMGLRALRSAARERARLLVQVHDGSAAQAQVVEEAAADGWRTGVSIGPRLVAEVVERHGPPLCGVQVLSTSTPGLPGGSFLPATWDALDELARIRKARSERWTIEVDGGLTSRLLADLADRCDLGVIGSNVLRTRTIADLFGPDELPEGSWNLNTST